MLWQSSIKTTHTWIGLIFGAFLCVTCLSGSIAVFRPELEAAFSPKVAPSMTRADLDDVVARVLASSPGARLTRVRLPAPEQNAFVLTLESGKKSPRRIVVDAGTGVVAGELRLAWLDWMIDLHHNLLAGRAGRRAVGAVGVALFFVSATGLLLSLLRNPTWKSLITVRRGPLRRRFYYELHRATGLWTYAFLLTLSFTGIALAYPEAFRAVMGQRTAVAAAKSSRKQSLMPLKDYLSISRAALPLAELTEMRLPKSSGDLLSVRFRMPSDLGEAGRNEALIASDGGIVGVHRLDGEPLGVRVQSAFTPIHYGEVGGLAVRLLWAVAGVAPAMLFITGLLFWLRKTPHRNVEPNQQAHDSRDEFLVTPSRF